MPPAAIRRLEQVQRLSAGYTPGMSEPGAKSWTARALAISILCWLGLMIVNSTRAIRRQDSGRRRRRIGRMDSSVRLRCPLAAARPLPEHLAYERAQPHGVDGLAQERVVVQAAFAQSFKLRVCADQNSRDRAVKSPADSASIPFSEPNR